jgi:uroporphyrinogen-III synthase
VRIAAACDHPLNRGPNGAPLPLSGKTIALPETRELDRLASMLEDEGATTWRCPLVAILDAPDSVPVDAWVRRLADEGGFDDLIFLTGEGLRRLHSRAKKLGVDERFRAGLSRARKITRGPKPARALHELDLSSDLPARMPTTQGVIDMLAKENLAGRRVGVQLYGTDPNETLIAFLKKAGAKVDVVAPYVYASASDEERVVALITGLASGALDALAFTSASQVDRLFTVAEEAAKLDELRAGLARTRVAAIGPVVAEALQDRSVRLDIAPEGPFVLRRLVEAIVLALKA